MNVHKAGPIPFGKNLDDFARSVRNAKSGDGGVRLMEGSIDKSLMILAIAKLLFVATEITTSLLLTLLSQLSIIMDGQKAGSNIEHPLSDQRETLRMSLKNTTSSLVSYAQAQDEILNSLDKSSETSASANYLINGLS
ncbi:hypothetical protein IGI04_000667 [Brassica rapa subsp. trilocularis]|uniref:Uncharacterized protein n=1 Tax=Brassica rapa subsp. trilocularis TaxID=1813537 RepID=A0ABQ7NQK6_BRACM|nr:hypothetical protein IGI04_000667 [Brassica rapa subsp. trilocularis]